MSMFLISTPLLLGRCTSTLSMFIVRYTQHLQAIQQIFILRSCEHTAAKRGNTMNWAGKTAVISSPSKHCQAILLTGLLTTLLLASASATAATRAAWVEDKLQQPLTKEIVEMMQTQHFRKMPLDDALSSMLLDNYLKALRS
ncbi:MAG: hypothetical protein R3E67_06235 [Pseudomonadales bacterium]